MSSHRDLTDVYSKEMRFAAFQGSIELLCVSFDKRCLCDCMEHRKATNEIYKLFVIIIKSVTCCYNLNNGVP